MIQDNCPIPQKKLRISLSSDGSENEELNLSPSFDETYKNLMEDEMVAICLKQYNSICDINVTNNLSDFLKKCDDLQMWIETVLGQSKKQLLCRCDFYVDRIYRSRQLLQSSRFVQVKMIGQALVSKEPQHQETIQLMVQTIENQWHSSGLFTDLTVCHVLDDINEDIADLMTWLGDVKQKLDFGLGSADRKRDVELIEYILRDFEIHNEMGLAVIKVINELQNLSCPLEYYDRIIMSKSKMDSLEGDIYQQWLNAIEYKLRLDELAPQASHLPCGLFGFIGQESGFESEMSPLYNARRLGPVNNAKVMTYISSGDDGMSDCTTELPSDSQSAETSAIDIPKLSSESLSSSSGTMPESSPIKFLLKENLVTSKRIIRRKKRRTKRLDRINQCPLSTEESENYWKNNEKSSLKRRINETNNRQLSELPTNFGKGLNYLDIADDAERLVRKSSSKAEYLPYESPKESEIEDLIGANKRALHDSDIERNWDYYQAPMYSNEDGDSQILEVDKIKDWEPELDTDGVEVLPVDYEGEDSPKSFMKRMSLLTSGYETNMEADQTICSKSLICVLQFTTSHCHDIGKKINDLFLVCDKGSPLSWDSYTTTLRQMNECKTVADMHMKLIRQILEYDPCPVIHNTTLIDNLKVMEVRWDRVRDKCLSNQVSIIDERMDYIGGYRDVEGLKLSIDRLQGLVTQVSEIKSTSERGRRDGPGGVLGDRVRVIKDRLVALKKARCTELDLALRCLACVAQSKCTRRLFSSGLRMAREDGSSNTIDVREIYEKFEKCIESLKRYMEDVYILSSPEYQSHVSNVVNKEIRSWQKLCDRVANRTMTTAPLLDFVDAATSAGDYSMPVSLHTIEGAHFDTSLRNRLFRHMPMQVAIVVVFALIGWWYSQSSSSAGCSRSSSDWIRLLYRFTDHLEPH